MPVTVPLHDTSDSALVARLLNGDLGALDALYDRHATALLRLSYRLSGSLADAEDVIQDLFVGLPLALRQYDERGKLEAWLRGVTVHTTLLALRRSRGRREVDFDSVPEPMSLSGEHPGDVLDRMTVAQAIARLPEPLRLVFVLRQIDQRSHTEIAELLGIKRNTSEVRFHRAIAQLRDTLRDDR